MKKEDKKMKKYKLIKKYPGSPELGTEATIETHGGFILNQPEFWEKVVEKDYEILSLIEDKFIYLCDKYSKDYIHQLFNTIGVNIHSVKRLSDGEIFTIGDYVEIIKSTNPCCEKGTIEDFNFWLYNINNLKKVKQKLFTTEDGVDIYEDDYSYGVHNSKFDIVKIKHTSTVYVGDNFIEFSTKEKAEEYVLMNKPCLSINNVINAYPSPKGSPLHNVLMHKLKQTVKSKI